MPLPDDLSLPTPPPPNPSRREAALAAGISRFESHHGRAASSLTAGAEQPVKRWAGLARPQLAAFATVALVAMVSVPLWIDRKPPSTERIAPAPPAVQFQPEADAVATPDASVTRMEVAPQVPDQRGEVAKSALPAPAVVAAPSEVGAAEVQDKVTRKLELNGLVAPSQQRAVAAPAPPPPAAMMPSASGKAALSEDSNIVVTGNRVDESDEAKERLRRESLDDARRRNADRAIVALDRKIEQAPGDADAYLGRGQQWRRRGDLARALADLDRAVRLAPRSARTYYERSLVLRRLGQTDRADADEQRAIELDHRYDAIIP